MRTDEKSTKTTSGPWSGYAISMLENLAAEGRIAFGNSLISAIYLDLIPTVLLARNRDADWALDVVEGLLRSRDLPA